MVINEHINVKRQIEHTFSAMKGFSLPHLSLK